MDINKMWNLIITEELSPERVDKFSINEIKQYDDLFICYFAQMGEFVDLRHPLGINYIRINKKIKKLNQ